MITRLTIAKPNIVVNPYFETDDDWSLSDVPPYWSIDPTTNSAVHVSGGTQIDYIYQTDTDLLKPGVTYRVTVTVSNYSGTGSLYIKCGGTSGAAIIANGTYQQDILCTTSGQLSFGGNTLLNCSISKISCVISPGIYDLDLSDDVDAPLTYNVADIRDPSKRNATFSKTITIPGSKNNNLAFNELFEINQDGLYNPNKKVRATVTQDGLEIFNGILQIKTINRTQNGLDNYSAISYEVILLGRIADIIYQLGDLKLQDLDFSEFDHNYNITNILNSWGGYASAGTIVIDGIPTSNWTTGAPKTVIGRTADADGRLQLEFSAAHGFTADQQVYYRSFCPMDLGDHKVKEVVSATKVVLYHPFNAGYSFTNDNVYARTPIAAGYVYPMVQYARNHPSIPLASSQVTGNNVWQAVDFVPAVYVKQYIDKIFEKAGFSYSSTFFDSALFKRLILTSKGNGLLQMTQTEIASRTVYAGMTGTQVFTDTLVAGGAGAIAGNIGQGGTVVFDDDSTLPFNDAGGQYTGGIITVAKDGFYSLKTNLKVAVKLNLSSGSCSSASLNLSMMIRDLSNPTFPQNTKELKTAAGSCNSTNLQAGTGITYDFSIQTPAGPTPQVGWVSNPPNNVWLKAGQQYSIRYRHFANLAGSSPAGTVTHTILPGSFVELVLTDYNLIEGSTMEINSTIPKDMYCKDLFLSLVKMFNLYVEADKTNDKKLIIETRDTFYTQGTTVNWTSKLDLSQPIVQTPMGELNAKLYNYKYKEGTDFYNLEYKKKFPLAKPPGYGDFQYEVDNDFIGGTSDTTLAFTATPMDETVVNASNVPGRPISTGRVISQIYSADLVSPTGPNPAGINVKPVESGARILYFSMAGANTTWHMQANAPAVTWVNFNTYPYAGHLDHVEGPDFDLNFGYPEGFVTLSPYTFDSWTDNNLFNAYYSRMIEEITGKDSKIVTAYFNLKPSDMYKLDFRNTVYIDGYHFRINKILDYSLTSNQPTKVELLKADYVRPFVKSHTILIGGGVGVPIGTGGGNGNPVGKENPYTGTDPLGDDPFEAEIGDPNFIDAGEDLVLEPFDGTVIINLVDAAEDEVLGIGGYTLLNDIEPFDTDSVYEGVELLDGIVPEV